MDHQPLSSHRSMCGDSLVFGPAQFVVVVCRLLSETAIWFQLSEAEITDDRAVNQERSLDMADVGHQVTAIRLTSPTQRRGRMTSFGKYGSVRRAAGISRPLYAFCFANQRHIQEAPLFDSR